MSVRTKCRKLFPFLNGAVIMFLGVCLILIGPQEKIISDMMAKEAELVEGRSLYESVWLELDIQFHVYLFDVQNPDEVMEGAKPEFVEHGPYVYDVNSKRKVLSIDEEADEMTFNTVRIYTFNKDLSKGSEDDSLTIINSAYVGTIGTMAASFASFLKKLGNDIEKLFPDMDDIFVRAKVRDILFGGLPMTCDPKQYPELKLICGFLLGKKPPGIKDTDVEGVYQWSFFDRLNGTAQGPMTVNRGVKNKTLLGDTTSFRGKRKQRIWASEECNKIKGSDAITWAPMPEKLDYVVSFEPQICRWGAPRFKEEVIVSGLVGRRYQVEESAWLPEEATCYCPVVKKQPVCLPTGIMDITKCQEAPIFYSEPHFLFGDASLRDYAKGLQPDVEKHASYIVIEPLSGAPLAGSKKLQLNAKITKTPVITMLANVTDGFFPILWAEETADSTVEMVAPILQTYRLLRLLRYMTYVPLVFGIYQLIKAAYTHGDAESDINVQVFVPTHSVLIRNASIHDSQGSITRRSRLHMDRDFE